MEGLNRLTDSFDRAHSYLRISLTDRCNLRCTYCMPEEDMRWLPGSSIMSSQEIGRLGRLFVSLGVRKIRLTGGEPTLRKDLLEIVETLNEIEGLEVLAMTTNGLNLERLAGPLRKAGVTHLTVSLDTLKAERFFKIAKRDRLQDVLKGIDAALEEGFKPLKINTVMMRRINDDELMDFIAFGKNRSLGLRFIEFMPFPENNWSTSEVVAYAEMHARISEKHKLTALSAERSAVGKEFALEHHQSTVSFISSMTDSFCSTCNRLRLTADGHIKACLFDAAERDLCSLMRAGGSDDDLQDLIAVALRQKPLAHPPMEELKTVENRTMISIGG